MESKCVLIKESEYEKLLEIKAENRNFKSKYESLQSKYDALYDRYEALNKEYFELNPGSIKVEFISHIKTFKASDSYWSANRWEYIKNNIIDSIECSISGTKVTIQGEMRKKLHDIKKTIENDIISYVTNYIDNENNRIKDNIICKCNTIIEEHNRLPWYKRFKKIIKFKL